MSSVCSKHFDVMWLALCSFSAGNMFSLSVNSVCSARLVDYVIVTMLIKIAYSDEI